MHWGVECCDINFQTCEKITPISLMYHTYVRLLKVNRNKFVYSTLLYSSHYSFGGSYSMRNGLVGKSERLRPIYLKICGCYSMTFLNWTRLYNWYMVWWESKDKHHKNTCLIEIKLCLQIQLTSSHSTMNKLGRTYVTNKRINKHALLIITTNSRNDQFQIQFFPHMLHYIVDLLTQHTFCYVKSNQLKVRDHK